MKARQALTCVIEVFKRHDIEDYQSEARILLCHVMKRSVAEFYTSFDYTLTTVQVQILDEFVDRRIRHEPVSYILGKKEFYGLDFYVNKNVLIPRPETELLVQEAIRIYKQISAADPRRKITIADIGTGCGAIAISIANNTDAELYAVDISQNALDTAGRNCEFHGLTDRIHLFRGYLLEPVNKLVNIVVANLPYISNPDLKNLSPEIINFEPLQALDGGKDGTAIIEELLKTCRPHLSQNGVIIIEFAYNQRDLIELLIDRYLTGSQRHFSKDLNEIDRIATIYL